MDKPKGSNLLFFKNILFICFLVCLVVTLFVLSACGKNPFSQIHYQAARPSYNLLVSCFLSYNHLIKMSWCRDGSYSDILAGLSLPFLSLFGHSLTLTDMCIGGSKSCVTDELHAQRNGRISLARRGLWCPECARALLKRRDATFTSFLLRLLAHPRFSPVDALVLLC